MNKWGGGATIGHLYRVSEADFGRVGHCWMHGRLLSGDLILCVAHSGDCFFDYILVTEYANGLEGIPGSNFGAYTLGEPVNHVPTAIAFAKLRAGQFVPLDGEYALRTPVRPALAIEAPAN